MNIQLSMVSPLNSIEYLKKSRIPEKTKKKNCLQPQLKTVWYITLLESLISPEIGVPLEDFEKVKFFRILNILFGSPVIFLGYIMQIIPVHQLALI
jgi:hypothetical protein